MKKILSIIFISIALIGNVKAESLTTPILDSGNGANANPIGGNWTTVSPLNACQRSSNTITGTTSGQANNACYWNLFTLNSNNGEVFGTITTKALVTGDVVDFFLINTSSLNGYAISYKENTTGTDSVVILRADSGTGTSIATYSQEISAGDRLLLKDINGTLYPLYMSGANGSWKLLGTPVVDNTYSVKGMAVSIDILYTATSEAVTNFGGGNPVNDVMFQDIF